MSKRSKAEFSEELDEKLKTIVENQKSTPQTFSWMKVSEMLYQQTQHKFDSKQCQNRYKNFLSSDINPSLKLDQIQKDQVFSYHCQGYSNKDIKQIIVKSKISDNQLKKACKVEKEKIGRILRQIYYKQIQEAQISNQNRNQHYRVLLVLFSTKRLLKLYHQEGVSIPQLKKKLFNFKQKAKKLQQQSPTQQFTTQNKDLSNVQTYNTLKNSVNELKEEIKSIVIKIYDIYSKIPSKNKGIKLKSSISRTKQDFTRRILLGIPAKYDLPTHDSCQKRMFQYQNDLNLSSCQKQNQEYCYFEQDSYQKVDNKYNVMPKTTQCLDEYEDEGMFKKRLVTKQTKIYEEYSTLI